MVITLLLINFGRIRFDYPANSKFIKFHIVDPEIFSILIFLKDLELASRPHFVYYFSRKIFLLYSIN